MSRIVWALLFGFSSVAGFHAVQASRVDAHQNAARSTRAGTVTRLVAKDLPDAPGKEGLVEIVDFAPGESSQIHRHNADLFVYVLEGSVVTQVNGEALQTIAPGGVFTESPADVHTVSRNASATEPAKLLVFYVKPKGAPPTVILKDGER